MAREKGGAAAAAAAAQRHSVSVQLRIKDVDRILDEKIGSMPQPAQQRG